MKFSKLQIKALVSRFYPQLKNECLQQFLDICRYESYENKEIILSPGRLDHRVFIILEGSARAYSIDHNGDEVNSHMRSKGFLFGDPRVFGEQPCLLTIEAITPIHVLIFNINTLEKLGFENPNLMRFYIDLMKEVIVTFSRRIDSFVTKTSKQRYLDLIDWNPEYLNLAYDKHLASFIGIKPLTLHRIKKELGHIK